MYTRSILLDTPRPPPVHDGQIMARLAMATRDVSKTARELDIITWYCGHGCK